MSSDVESTTSTRRRQLETSQQRQTQKTDFVRPESSLVERRSRLQFQDQPSSPDDHILARKVHNDLGGDRERERTNSHSVRTTHTRSSRQTKRPAQPGPHDRTPVCLFGNVAPNGRLIRPSPGERNSGFPEPGPALRKAGQWEAERYPQADNEDTARLA